MRFMVNCDLVKITYYDIQTTTRHYSRKIKKIKENKETYFLSMSYHNIRYESN